MIEIFNNYSTVFNVSHETVLKLYEKICADYSKKIKYINIIVLTDEELLKINNDYLSHDYYTDIITFDLSESPNIIEAELYISYERILENTKTNVKEELFRVLIHGLLHLMGLNDKTELEIKEMRSKENQYLEIINQCNTI